MNFFSFPAYLIFYLWRQQAYVLTARPLVTPNAMEQKIRTEENFLLKWQKKFQILNLPTASSQLIINTEAEQGVFSWKKSKDFGFSQLHNCILHLNEPI